MTETVVALNVLPDWLPCVPGGITSLSAAIVLGISIMLIGMVVAGIALWGAVYQETHRAF
ncbi:MAG TPA: hypothetical protein VGH99_09620 [Pseudonocardia sp.]|jgi:hypothetical protein